MKSEPTGEGVLGPRSVHLWDIIIENTFIFCKNKTIPEELRLAVKAGLPETVEKCFYVVFLKKKNSYEGGLVVLVGPIDRLEGKKEYKTQQNTKVTPIPS